MSLPLRGERRARAASWMHRLGPALLAPALALASGCALPAVMNRDYDPALLPRQSPDARELLALESNVNCRFTVDSQFLAAGRRVKVLVTRKEHHVVCQPEGYRAKDEYIQPPFDPGSPIGFTFLLEDRTGAGGEGGVSAQSGPASAPALSSDVDVPKYPASPEDPAKFALVVGVEKYANVPEAPFAERDAEAMRSHLRALGYPERNIIFLTGNQAVRSSLVKYLESWLPRNVTADSKVFFYFSGHGAPDVKTGQAYLLPWDGDAKFLDDTAYPVKRLYEKLNALPAKQVLVAMDSCFSGAGGRSVIPKGARPLVMKTDRSSVPSGKIVVLAAASGDEITGSAEPEGHGLFTYYLLKGLNEKAKDKGLTVKGLYDFLAPKVADAARRENRDQTPQLLPSRVDVVASAPVR